LKVYCELLQRVLRLAGPAFYSKTVGVKNRWLDTHLKLVQSIFSSNHCHHVYSIEENQEESIPAPSKDELWPPSQLWPLALLKGLQQKLSGLIPLLLEEVDTGGWCAS
jgi:hypothetical protein